MCIFAADLIYVFPVLTAHSRDHDFFDAIVAGTLDHGIPVAVENIEIEVTMAVYKIVHGLILHVFLQMKLVPFPPKPLLSSILDLLLMIAG
jgi:hypothetical protein